MPAPIIDRIAALKAKQDHLASRLSALQSKAKTDERKRDTRRKIVVGAAVLAAMERDAELAASVRQVLTAAVGRAQDKELLSELMTARTAKDHASDTPGDAHSTTASSTDAAGHAPASAA